MAKRAVDAAREGHSGKQFIRQEGAAASTHVCVLWEWTFPAAELVKGSQIKSGTTQFRYKRKDLILRAATEAIE